tara:strand:- start:319 stop:528 length:210 start_codon:yes stop_codon:yes gene_type:complete
MSTEVQIILNLLPVIGAVLGIYVRMNTQVEKLKGRVLVLERDRGEFKEMLEKCVEGIQEVKVLLAKKGI